MEASRISRTPAYGPDLTFYARHTVVSHDARTAARTRVPICDLSVLCGPVAVLTHSHNSLSHKRTVSCTFSPDAHLGWSLLARSCLLGARPHTLHLLSTLHVHPIRHPTRRPPFDPYVRVSPRYLVKIAAQNHQHRNTRGTKPEHQPPMGVHQYRGRVCSTAKPILLLAAQCCYYM